MTAIGLYLVRVGPNGASVGLAHLIESEIADRRVSHCGHQLRLRNRRGSLRTAGPLDGECSLCPPRPLSNLASSSQVDRIADQPEPVASEQDDWSPV